VVEGDMRLERRHEIVSSFLFAATTSVYIFLHKVGNSDLFWQITTGRWIVERGGHPSTDIFSFTAYGKPWIDMEWLSEVFFYSFYRLLGFDALSILSLVLGLSFTAILLLSFVRGSKSYLISSLLVFAVLISGAMRFQQLRPEIIAYIIFASFLFILIKASGGRRSALWFLIPLEILWANVHASAIVGPIMAAIFLLRHERNYGYLALVMLSALINPYTYHAYTYPVLHLASAFTISEVGDWKGMFGLGVGRAVIVFMVACALPCAIRAKRIFSPTAIVALSFFLAALWIPRFIPFASISSAYLIAGSITEDVRDRIDARLPLVMKSLCAFFIVFMVAFRAGPPIAVSLKQGVISGREVGYGMDHENFPERAAALIKGARLNGNMFNDMAYGGYLIYELWPDHRVFIDTRTMVYGDEFLKRYSNALFDKAAFQGVVDEFDVGYVIYDSRQLISSNPPLAFLFTDPEWKLLYSDQNSALFYKQR
jgi:hypothetical protein